VLPAEFVPEADSISGVQFDLQYDSSSMTLAATLGDSAMDSGKSLYCIYLTPNTKRFLVVGPNQNVLSAGVLVNLSVNLNPDAPTGVYPLAFSNVEATDPFGNAASISGACGTITVQGTGDQSAAPQPTGVLNGASLLPGPVAPGEVVTLIGSGIGPVPAATPVIASGGSVPAGTSALLDGTPVNILYAGPGQINLVIPYSVSGKTAAQLLVTNAGQVVASLPLSIVPTAPAIFTLDGSGVGPGAVLNEDSTVNSRSNAATRGSVAVLFATGAGQVVGDILPEQTALSVSVQLGGLHAEVLGVRTLPELLAGVLEVKFRVPAAVAPGHSVPVVLNIGKASSQPHVTLAVR
jgi:uncharacterized protein (TIGR03437 family)